MPTPFRNSGLIMPRSSRSGSEFSSLRPTKEQLLDSVVGDLCALRWPQSLAVKLSALWKELDLTPVCECWV